ncbi:AAA family ATPase [Streptomyces sp. NPDC095817]|uniref:ATP-binding protein n=1 Tax=Streptomyces sp. NPDC095817 TaxID=3155082 RepID=UPI00332BB86D
MRGRQAEQARLAEFITAVEHRGEALVLRGEPGIGKTALLDAAVQHARGRGLTVLTAQGIPAENRLPFGALHQLLWPLLRDGKLPAAPRQILKAALGQTSTVVPDLYGVAFAALDLLVEAAGLNPLLVVAEDAHWFDRPTADVLGFVARRLAGEPMSVLAAVRDGHDDPFTDAGLPELRLEPLSSQASRELLEEQARDLPLRTRTRILETARGNPLALLELPAAVRQSGEVERPLHAHLHTSARLERAFAARLPDIPPATRTVLLALAADGGCRLPELLATAAQITGAPIAVQALEPAITAGLVTTNGSTAQFRHPLVASAVYQNASLTDRIATHAALADVLAAEPNRAVWHRAAAAMGPDPQIAADLRAFADRAVQRGAVPVAVDALERAATLTPTDTERAGLLLHAAELACNLPGRKTKTGEILDSTRLIDLGVRDRARRALLEELAGLRPADDPSFTRTLIDHALAAHQADERDLSQSLLWAAALRCWMHGSTTAFRSWFAATVHGLDPRMDDGHTALVLACLQPIDRGRAVLERAARIREQSPYDPVQMRHALGIEGLLGEYPSVVAAMAATASHMRDQGCAMMHARFLSVWAGADIWVGHWDRALDNSRECERLATALDEPVWRLMALGHRIAVAAHRSQHDQAEALGKEILTDPHLTPYLRAVAHRALGINALTAGHPDEAYDRLSRLFDPTDPVHHYCIETFSIAELADAARAAHRLPQARTILNRLEPLTARTTATAFHISMNHARALLALDDEAEPLLTSALADPGLANWPYHQARLHLAYGQHLRRTRRTTDARPHLRRALDLLDPLGAVYWADQARNELRATGAPSPDHAPGPDTLTPQELRIAQLAAQGLTNRAIGQQLHMSHRTVGAHLYKIFPKLGITARIQLPRVLAHRQKGSLPPP